MSYVVTAGYLGVWLDPPDKVNRRHQRFGRGKEISDDVLQYTDVDRLLKLGAIREIADDSEDESEDEPENESGNESEDESEE